MVIIIILRFFYHNVPYNHLCFPSRGKQLYEDNIEKEIWYWRPNWDFIYFGKNANNKNRASNENNANNQYDEKMFESISVDFHVDLSLCRHSILQYSATPFNISNQYWYISIFNISNQYECSSKFICPLAGLPGRKGICWAKLGFNLWLLDRCLSFIWQSSLSLSQRNIVTTFNFPDEYCNHFL